MRDSGGRKTAMIMVRKGEVIPPGLTMEGTLKDFGADSVFIKGANAIDLHGNVGVYVANHSGGTVGFAIGTHFARGSQLVVPVGLEKLIPSVQKAAKRLGQDTVNYSMDIKIGMVLLMNAKVITEVQSFLHSV